MTQPAYQNESDAQGAISDNPALAGHADSIRALRKRAADDIIDIGRHLTEAKKIAGHGNWLPWLDREFGWTDDTARNFMRVYDLSKTERVRDLNLPLRALYLIAAPSTPEAAREEVIDRAQTGEKVSVGETKHIIEQHKASPEPSAPASDNAADADAEPENAADERSEPENIDEPVADNHDGLPEEECVEDTEWQRAVLSAAEEAIDLAASHISSKTFHLRWQDSGDITEEMAWTIRNAADAWDSRAREIEEAIERRKGNSSEPDATAAIPPLAADDPGPLPAFLDRTRPIAEPAE
jgi:DUF3102 family protein